MIAVICLLAFLAVGHCLEDLPTRREIELSINRTIDEVERLVNEDPNLPRLSRSQIVDILLNITSSDMKNYEQTVEKTRDDYKRALMIVLPFSSNSSNQDLNELYTKAPLTKILDDKKSDELQNQKDSRPYENHREIFSEVSTQRNVKWTLENDKKIDSGPSRVSVNLEKLGNSRTKVNPKKSSTKDSSTEKNPSTQEKNLEIVFSTKVTEKPTASSKNSDDQDNGFRPTMPTSKSTTNVLTSDQWRYNAPPSRNSSKNRQNQNSRNRVKTTMSPFLPTMPSKNKEETKNSHIFVTPNSENSQKIEKNSTIKKIDPASTKAPMHMREEVQDLLASIGLRPDSENKNNKSSIKDDHEKIFGTNFQIPESNLIPGGISGLTSIGEISPSIVGQNTFENPPQEVKKGVENLSPDVQLLFQRFGLQTLKKIEVTTTTTTTEKPRTRISFWNNFKPLPDSRVKDEGMREFLAKFGLIDDGRKEKSMNVRRDSEKNPSVIEAVPGQMKNILENIGLISRSKVIPETKKNEEKENLHVFKPHETLMEDEKQREKINKLLDTVRMVQEGKSDVQEVQKAANDLLESTKTLKNSPEAMTLEEILKIYNEDVKNQIKRQQDPEDLKDMAISENSTTQVPEMEISSNSSSDSSAASSDVLTTTEDSSSVFKDSGLLGDTLTTETSNLDSLADSFGGSTSAPDENLPTPRRTGLYFLVDWNTFLEVGEDGPNKVNLRFQPKAGDRTRFLPVTVP